MPGVQHYQERERICQLGIVIILVIRISGHGSSSLVFQWGSTMKSPRMRTVISANSLVSQWGSNIKSARMLPDVPKHQTQFSFFFKIYMAYHGYVRIVLFSPLDDSWSLESPSLHFYQLKGSLTSHTIQAWYESNWPFMTLYVIHSSGHPNWQKLWHRESNC